MLRLEIDRWEPGAPEHRVSLVLTPDFYKWNSMQLNIRNIRTYYTYKFCLWRNIKIFSFFHLHIKYTYTYLPRIVSCGARKERPLPGKKIPIKIITSVLYPLYYHIQYKSLLLWCSKLLYNVICIKSPSIVILYLIIFVTWLLIWLPLLWVYRDSCS